MSREIGGYDMKHAEFRELCRKAWSQKFTHLCNDMIKNKNEVEHRILKESKNTYIGCICESELFIKLNVVSS